MRKLLAVLLVGIMLISLASCGSAPASADDASTKPQESVISAEKEEETPEALSEGSDESVDANSEGSEALPEGAEESADGDSETSEISPEFKEAMDSYEVFFDEYVEFMKKYEESDGSDLNLLSDYADYMAKYADTMEKMSEIDEEELSLAEAAYYAEVSARIAKKLAEIAE